MRVLLGACGILALTVPLANCLPDVLFDAAFDAAHDKAARGPLKERAAKRPKFDANAQHISTNGIHKFQAPGPTDQRGPCPGLNAMANHGYLPRNGFATIPEFITACTTVFGMGTELATVLAAYGAAVDGVGVGWSIGGKRFGIGGSHNNYETDSSPLRADLNQYGSNTRLVMSQFQSLYDLQPSAKTANYDLEVMRQFRHIRFQESIAKNPWFFYSTFSGTVVSQAAFTFIYRFMGNKSAEHPEGRLNKNVLKSFMSITGPENDLKWIPGHERIPDDWYTRNQNDPYDVNYLSKDINYVAATQPEITQAGCNQGKVNTFVKINTTDEAGQPITEGNPLCVGLAWALQSAAPTGVVFGVLQEAILPVQNSLGCETIPKLNTSVGKTCPGYSLYGGPKGKIAPGAIQN